MSVADVLAVRNEYRLQNWVEVIRECQESGLSNKEFCAQRGISEKTYYYWLRKVRTAATAVMAHLVQMEEPSENKEEHKFEIRYGKTELRLPEGVNSKALAVF